MKIWGHLLVGLLVLSACVGGGDRRFSALLDRTDSLMRVEPDSAYALLEGMRDTVRSLSEPMRMRYHLLHAKAQNKAYVDFTTDSLLLQLTRYYDRHGTPNDRMLAYYLLGCVYRDLGEAPKAMECYQTALDKVDTTAADCDYYDLSRVYAQMATTFHNQNLPEDQLYAQRMYEKYAWLAKDTLDALIAYGNRAGAYFLKNELDSMLEVGYNAYRRFLKYEKINHAVRQISFLYAYYAEHGLYDSAHKYFVLYDKKSGFLDTLGNVAKGHETYYYHKGLYYLGISQMDSAEQLFRKLAGFHQEEAEYQGLLSLYKKKHNADSIAKYAQLFCDANDSIHRKRNSQMVHQISAMYNYGRSQRLAMEKERELSHIQKVNGTIYGIVALLLILASSATYHYRQKHRKEMERKELEYVELVSRKYQAEAEMQQRLANHQALLDEKEEERKQLLADWQELNAIQAQEKERLQLSYQRQLSRKEEAIERLKQEHLCFQAQMAKTIADMQEQINSMHSMENYASTSSEFLSSEIVGRFRRLTVPGKQGYQLPTKEEWSKLLEVFINCHPKFPTMVQTTQLTTDEQKVCMLVMANFSSSEISILMEKSIQSITNQKARIGAKLFGKSEATNLHNRLYRHLHRR